MRAPIAALFTQRKSSDAVVWIPPVRRTPGPDVQRIGTDGAINMANSDSGLLTRAGPAAPVRPVARRKTDIEVATQEAQRPAEVAPSRRLVQTSCRCRSAIAWGLAVIPRITASGSPGSTFTTTKTSIEAAISWRPGSPTGFNCWAAMASRDQLKYALAR